MSVSRNEITTKFFRNLMESAEKLTFGYSDCEIDLMRECLTRGGTEIHLRRKSYQVLLYLIEQRERLVSKEELIRNVWPNTAVTDDVLVQSVKEIRRSFGDDPHHPRFIKTVPKSGYRFIGEVQTTLPSEPANVDSPATMLSPSRSRRFSARAYLIAASILLVGLTLAYGLTRFRSADTAHRPAVAGKRSVAVMFFENQSNSAELEWLREGLADMLIAGLSRSAKLNVLSRGQLSTWLENRRTDPASDNQSQALEIARQTQAEVYISGVFARLGDRVRLDVQIYDTVSGDLLGSESLTVEKPEQILTEIDLISLKVARRLDAVPDRDGTLANLMTKDLAAYRYYSLGVEKAQSLQNKEAIELLEKAVERDPDFAMAHARIGYAYAVSWGLIDHGKPYLEKAFLLSERLTEKDRLDIATWYAIANLDFELAIQNYREIIKRFAYDTEAYSQLAKLLAGEQRRDEAVDVLRQGLSVDSQAKNLYNTLGNILSTQGKHTEAIAAHQQYVELAPTDPNAYDSLGLSYQWAGNYPLAIENYERGLKLDPDFDIALVHLANTRFRMGQYRAAIAGLRNYIAAAPSDGERGRGFEYLTFIYLRQGNIHAAAEAAKAGSVTYKGSLWPMYIVARQRGNTREAERLENEFLAKVVKSDRGSRASPRFKLYYQGVVALNHARNDEALEYFRQTLEHSPVAWNLQDFEDCLADAFLKLGRFDEAIAEYNRILVLTPNYPLARFHLGQSFQATGRNAEAVTAYQMFLHEWAEADQDISEVVAARKFVTSQIGE